MLTILSSADCRKVFWRLEKPGKGVFRTQSNIYDRAFCEKKLMTFSRSSVFASDKDDTDLIFIVFCTS